MTTRTAIAKELRAFTKSGTVGVSQLAAFLGRSDQHKVKKKYLSEDPDSDVPVLSAIGGRRYLISEVAVRLEEAIR